jgi:ABC-type amino acid transport substrate-binding protein
MTSTFRKVLLIALLILLAISACGSPGAVPVPGANSNDTITVVMDNNYPPFSFRDAKGDLTGVSVDMWRLFQKQTGIPVNITGLGWDEALHRMEAGEFDVIDTLFYSEDRAKVFDFTPAYSDVDVVIFFNNDLAGIKDLDSLEGFVVGMHRGDSTVEEVMAKGITVREYDNYEEVVRAAREGQIVVFILDKPSGVHYLYKTGIQDKFRYTDPVFHGELHRAVRKGNTSLLAVLNDGFLKVPAGEYSAIEQKWYGTPVIPPHYLQYILVFVVSVALIISLLLFLNRTLKRKVAQRTVELNQELLRRKEVELEILKKNEELSAANEEMTSTAEELEDNYLKITQNQHALTQARNKLNLLNYITFTELRNALFSLNGYLELEKEFLTLDVQKEYHRKVVSMVDAIEDTLAFAKTYQDLGMKAPCWQEVEQVFLFGISHLDFLSYTRNLSVQGLTVYADPMLEWVFFNLAQNVVMHAETATEVTLRYEEHDDGLVLFFEDNGVGVPDPLKTAIFERRYEEKNGVGLFLIREILEVTGITIRETGIAGKGARFEMHVPKGGYRFSDGSR